MPAGSRRLIVKNLDGAQVVGVAGFGAELPDSSGVKRRMCVRVVAVFEASDQKIIQPHSAWSWRQGFAEVVSGQDGAGTSGNLASKARNFRRAGSSM